MITNYIKCAEGSRCKEKTYSLEQSEMTSEWAMSQLRLQGWEGINHVRNQKTCQEVDEASKICQEKNNAAIFFINKINVVLLWDNGTL